jgi:hypothetical protein
VSERDSMIAQLEAWYGALAPREQLIVRVGSVVAAALLLVVVLLQLHGVVARAEKRVAAKRADVA